MKLFEINKPRVRIGPDGRMVQAPSADTIPWQRPAMPRKRTRKPKVNPMQARQQEAQPLSPEAKQKQASTKAAMLARRDGKLNTSLKANSGSAPLNPSMASSGIKQANNLTSANTTMTKQAQTPSSRFERGGDQFTTAVQNIAKKNPKSIDQILQVLNKALSKNSSYGADQQLGYRDVRRAAGRQRTRTMTRQQADAYLQKKGIQVTESTGNPNLPMGAIFQQALKMNRVALINLIKDLEDIKKEGTKIGQQHTGNYRNRPSLVGVDRDDVPSKVPAKPQSRFSKWLSGSK
jgi:hypothetical protein